MNVKKVFQRIIAPLFIIMGIIGILLPIIPGTPFLLFGLFLLGIKRKQVKKFLRKVRKKYLK